MATKVQLGDCVSGQRVRVPHLLLEEGTTFRVTGHRRGDKVVLFINHDSPQAAYAEVWNNKNHRFRTSDPTYGFGCESIEVSPTSTVEVIEPELD